MLAVLGMRLIRCPLAGHALHIDGQLVMVDHDLALINIERTPYWFLDTLRELKIRWVEVHHADNPRVAELPRRAAGQGAPRHQQRRRAPPSASSITASRWCRSTTRNASENGGGIHCSTLPLVRDRS